MEEIKLTEDVTLKLARASFQDALALKGIVLKKIKINDISLGDLDPSKLQDVASLDTGGDFFKSLISQIMMLESDEELTKAIFKCAKKSTINGEKIVMDMFEDRVDLWQHIIDIKIEVLKYNLTPFFKGVLSSIQRVMS